MRNPGGWSIAVVISISLALTSCGGYRHRQRVEHIVAVSWTADDRPVRLLQDVTAKWEFWGLSPHIVDPTYDLGRLSMAVGQDRPVSVAGFDDWWHVDLVVARRPGRGFVVQLSKNFLDHKETYCVVIPIGEPQTRCSLPSLEFVAVKPNSDGLVAWKADGSMEAFGAIGDRAARRTSVCSVWQLGAHGVADPCDMSYSAIAPDETAWIVACRINRQPGLWLIDEQRPPRLLLAADLPKFIHFQSGPTRSAEVIRDIEDRIRLFDQEFGLAWSPDGRRIYYCANPNTQAVVVNVAEMVHRQVDSCGVGAVWSDDRVRVAGVNGDGTLGVVDLGPG